MGKKRKFEVEQKDNNEFGLPAKFLATSHVRAQDKRLIIILEGAQLETVKVVHLFSRRCNSQSDLCLDFLIDTIAGGKYI